MTHKSGRISERVAHLAGGTHDPRYLGYFECFNAGDFYEAHDVLEDLWLESRGQSDADFYKALIQLAGAFVHLTKHDPAKGSDAPPRLRPAHKLFSKAKNYLEKYPKNHHGLNLEEVTNLIEGWTAALEIHQFELNPLHQRPAPNLAVI